jgi:hypothetical protein
MVDGPYSLPYFAILRLIGGSGGLGWMGYVSGRITGVNAAVYGVRNDARSWLVA